MFLDSSILLEFTLNKTQEQEHKRTYTSQKKNLLEILTLDTFRQTQKVEVFQAAIEDDQMPKLVAKDLNENEFSTMKSTPPVNEISISLRLLKTWLFLVIMILPFHVEWWNFPNRES